MSYDAVTSLVLEPDGQKIEIVTSSITINITIKKTDTSSEELQHLGNNFKNIIENLLQSYVEEQYSKITPEQLQSLKRQAIEGNKAAQELLGKNGESW